ncbi:MAG: molybdopterin molybdenumtransferase MoeA [Gemmatales bacterium]|nr:MAG: molybdopterin molybdenumtransferase MoeA [Gemmatales bacterium]
MQSIDEARSLVMQQARPLPPAVFPLMSSVLGCVLAEDVVADIDMPPFDKAMMDGYAVRADDIQDGKAILAVAAEITAGDTAERPLQKGQAARIMTGAPIPAGSDAVVMMERTRPAEPGLVAIDDPSFRPGQNILPRGQEMRRGEVVVASGTVLRPQEFGLLAGVGRTAVRIHPQPTVAILATGNELVDVSSRPGPGQIRNSNGTMLVAQVSRGGGIPRHLGIARDDPGQLRSLIRDGLASDMLVLSGGVSAGDLDLVPGILQELGVTTHFHKVKMKPGKPVFFGTADRRLVFGLPGNPVSCFVCFELFVRPAIRALAGHKNAGPRLVRATLTEDFSYQSDRPTFHPARVTVEENGFSVRVCPWFGSADLRGILSANAFIVLPEGVAEHRAGAVFDVLLSDDLLF